MRANPATNDEVLAAAKENDVAEQKYVEEGISMMARQSMQSIPSYSAIRNGIMLLSVHQGAPCVTSEMVRQLENELL